jgi:hypothetical protein
MQLRRSGTGSEGQEEDGVISINGVEQGGGGMQGKKGVTSDETGARKMRQRLEALVTYAGRVVAGGVLLCAGLALYRGCAARGSRGSREVGPEAFKRRGGGG